MPASLEGLEAGVEGLGASDPLSDVEASHVVLCQAPQRATLVLTDPVQDTITVVVVLLDAVTVAVPLPVTGVEDLEGAEGTLPPLATFPPATIAS